ncbi:MAG: hypothetical protein HC769_08025 [Cyanobacteria bacterium CRU_2_1]|nr:hypothetical protein [Cyanobacteria bacterium CRU_2_1]
MAPNPAVMQAVEKLDYRVTVGDVASQAGLDIKIAERDLLALASEARGHLQVAESGEIAYAFPRNFRDVLRNKYWRLRWQETWNKIWKILFYIIRISFGLLLIASIILILLAILIIFIAATASRNDGDSGGGGDDRSGGGGFVHYPSFWFAPDWYWIFLPDYDRYSSQRQRERSRSRNGADRQMNFLEAVYSFLFGDGDPNIELEERRWQAIATTIRNNRGGVVAEQIAPYLDDIGNGYQREYEEYILPVLTRFNGRPEVSPEGQIVYHFPELQVSATQRNPQPVSAYLRELPWRFSQAGSGQLILAGSLGVVNLGGALLLGSLLRDGTIAAQLGGLVAFVSSIYWLLLVYGIGFLTVPLIRYFWIQGRNRRIESRNQNRQAQAVALNEANNQLQQKIAFAQLFAASTVVDESDLAYTTERDLTEQELLNADKIDAEWRRRLGEDG